MPAHIVSRRSFIAISATLPWALQARAAGSIPIGLELYSVREELKKDPEATVRAVAQLGYQCVEFYAPYFEWTETQTKRESSSTISAFIVSRRTTTVRT
jgi:hypothetical protein